MALGRPPGDYTFTSPNVAAHMRPGKAYMPSTLARMFSVPTADMKAMLEQMAADATIDIAHIEGRRYGFQRGPAPIVKPPVPVATSIATKIIPVRLTGTMKGYDVENAKNRDLCMAARGRL